MAELSFTITSVTRTNSLTAASVTIKKVIPKLNNEPLIHEYIFDGTVADADAKISVKDDLQNKKGYTWASEV